MSRKPYTLLSAAVLLLASAQQASAYIDPGSGSLLLQILGGAAVGCLFYVRRFFGWLGGKRKADGK